MKKAVALSMVALAIGAFSITPVHAKRAGFTGLTGLADAADTAFWNPAGITRLPHTLQVQAALGYNSSNFEVEAASYSGGDPKSQNDFLFIPGVYYARPLNDDWYFGASLNVPSGIGTDYEKYWSGRYHADETSLVFVSLGPSLAYKWNESLSLAAGIDLMYVASESKVRVNNQPLGTDGSVKLQEDGVGIGFNLSALYEFSETTRMGINYRSETEPDLEGTPILDNVNLPLVSELADVGVLGQTINADFKTPQILAVGLYHELNETYSITLDAAWIDMSEFGVEHVDINGGGISVPSIFEDMYGGGAGLGYQWDDKTEFSVGFFYMTSPVEELNDRTLFLPLDEIKGFGIGMRKELPDDEFFEVKLDYADLGNAPVLETGPQRKGVLSGHYEKNYAILLDFNYSFRFN